MLINPAHAHAILMPKNHSSSESRDTFKSSEEPHTPEPLQKDIEYQIWRRFRPMLLNKQTMAKFRKNPIPLHEKSNDRLLNFVFYENQLGQNSQESFFNIEPKTQTPKSLNCSGFPS